MDHKHETPSVIAKLMDLDKEQPQHHFRGKKRVLSEKYLQKVASIGVRVKHSFHEYNSSGARMEEKENPIFSKAKTRGMEEICDAEYVAVNMKPESFMASTRSFGTETSTKLRRMSQQRSLQLLQNIDNGLQKDLNREPGLHEIFRFSKPQLELKDETFHSGIAVLKPSPQKGESGLKNSPLLSPYENYPFSNGFLVEFSFPERGRVYPERRGRKAFRKISQENYSQTGNAVSRDSDRVSSSVFRWNETFSKRSNVLKPASKSENLHNSPIFCSEDSFVAANDKILEQRDVTENLSIPAHGLGTGNLAYKLGNHGYQINSSDAQVNDRRVPNPGRVCVPSVSAGNPQTRTKTAIFQHHRSSRQDASINWVPKNLKRQNFFQKDCSEHISLRSSSKKSLSLFSYLSNDHTEENHIALHKLKGKFRNGLSDQKHVLPQSKRSKVPSNFKDSQIMQETCFMKDEPKNHKIEDNNMLEKILPPNSSIDCVAADTKIEFTRRPCGNQKEYGALAHILLRRDRKFSGHTSGSSVEQGTSEFHEEDSVCSFCSGTYSDSHASLEVFEPSPMSVLEPPFREDLLSSHEFMETVDSDVSCNSECTKVVGSDIYDPAEMDTEGHDLNVSSDEDPDEGSISDFERKQDLPGFFRVEESRDFSYVVEVLTGAGFSNRSLYADFPTWNSADCPISPSVFEMLEKKFGEQPLWKRSDRKLLFDCVNLGLVEILSPRKYFSMREKPMLRRLIAEPCQNVIEEELWALFVSQEKEAKEESADKMVGGEIRWAELSEDTDAIVIEIVKFLVDKLAEETV